MCGLEETCHSILTYYILHITLFAILHSTLYRLIGPCTSWANLESIMEAIRGCWAISHWLHCQYYHDRHGLCNSTSVKHPITSVPIRGLPQYSSGTVSVWAENPGALSKPVVLRFRMVNIVTNGKYTYINTYRKQSWHCLYIEWCTDEITVSCKYIPSL